ncbi:P-loop containing nucleoside triphosphate hydrolase protein [Polychytrium aggregatum]|uniref:P-loop containing nucleoside triphosphate hydrolase protein n=1 Tax=Polychytrium aggregatum TaxID=110093 RepID=UPI0022FE19BB|nr:P-loop containing nucleoside triphosphate hydrolase protein [Polychytrium aggregatum]KAI9203308.1 P-loop containing nucleoside triphosphate hydrolase protein [Polychytrium aggregatum]
MIALHRLNTCAFVPCQIRPTSTDASLPHRPLVLGVVQGHPTQVTLSTPSHHYTNNLNSSGGRCFTFDHVFDQPTLQEHLYNRVCRSLVEQFLDGFNVTILAYGQTSSGKTFTMGSAEPDQNHLRGIIPRVIQQIFESPQTSDPSSFNLKVSFVEIYQEQLRDLLSGEGENREIAIREDRTGAINLSGVSEPQIRSADDALKFVRTGSQARTTGDTQMHLYSSRSHAIFTLTLQQRCPKSDTDGSSKILKYSKIHLVDLAGSERAKRTGAEGLRFKESIKVSQRGHIVSPPQLRISRTTCLCPPLVNSKNIAPSQDQLGPARTGQCHQHPRRRPAQQRGRRSTHSIP